MVYVCVCVLRKRRASKWEEVYWGESVSYWVKAK